MDRAFWQSVIDADGALPAGHTVAELTPELLGYLGSIDPFLRDEVAFEVLAAWIVRDNLYPPDQLRAIGDALADNLTIGLGQQGDDSIFLRSFSALVLNKVIEADNWHATLAEADIRRWMKPALAYTVAERDTRGQVPGHGWAHAIAHAADVLWVLAQSRHLTAPDLALILDTIAARVTARVEQPYLYNEDQRLSFAAMAVFQRNILDLPAAEAWIDRMIHPGGGDWRAPFESLASTVAYHNTTTFLRSLYLQILLGIRPPAWYPDQSFFRSVPALREEIMALLIGALKALDRGFYPKDARDDSHN
jgi:hypothetical protein